MTYYYFDKFTLTLTQSTRPLTGVYLVKLTELEYLTAKLQLNHEAFVVRDAFLKVERMIKNARQSKQESK